MSKNKAMNEFPLLSLEDGIPLFYPHIPKLAIKEVTDTLSGRWIGQGPKVDRFESLFKESFLGDCSPLAVGSGTDALHLAYLLAGVKENDEVLVPVFTCTATNIPLLYIGAKPIFVDVDINTMNISIDDLESKITNKTKAIVCVDYGGVPCNYNSLEKICKKYNLKLISDAAHAIGSRYQDRSIGEIADFTVFSFQAIKTLTTGDGGLLSIKDKSLLEKAKRLRWFGIDRSEKQKGVWENDIKDVGYKYQMTDISASIGIAGMKEISDVILQRNNLFRQYEDLLSQNPRLIVVGKSSEKNYYNSAWLMTIIVDQDRKGLMKKLRDHGVESAQVHYRNDRYQIFGGRLDNLTNMDLVEDRYLVLPLHTKMNTSHVDHICNIINSNW
jgi:perosamine synthetase